jgi:predicted ribosome quality control (RQC) complex YloA/Tae2 family protein
MDGLSIAASLSELTAELVGATVRTVYQPAKDRFVLRAFSRGDLFLVIDLGASAIYRTDDPTANPASPSPLAMLLRKHLRGARILSAQQMGLDRSVSMAFSRREASDWHGSVLVAELLGARGNVHLVCAGIVVHSLREDSRNTIGQPFVPLPSQAKHDPGKVTEEQLRAWLTQAPPDRVLAKHIEGIGRDTAHDLSGGELGDDPARTLHLRLRETLSYVASPRAHLTPDGARATFYPLPSPSVSVSSFQDALAHTLHRALLKREVEPQPSDVMLRGLRTAMRSKERTLQKLTEWLDQADQAAAWQAQADLLMTYASSIGAGIREVTLTDPATQRGVLIPLDPSLSPRQNAQRLYERAKRLRRGHPHVQRRLTRVRGERDLLRSAIEALERGEAIPAAALDLLPSRRSGRSKITVTRPFRRFEAEGFVIWVGKSARQNDALLRAAAPNDLWLHVRDHAGSHVVVRTGGQPNVPQTVVVAAARLAARHSKASSEPRAEVLVTRVKHVRKPKGAPAGLANVQVSDTLTVDLVEKGDA